MENRKIHGEFLGEGASKRVFVDAKDENRVIGEYKGGLRSEKKEYTAKARYYAQKILHEFFPEHFPNVHNSGAKPDRIVLDRVEPEESYAAILPVWNEYYHSTITDETSPSERERLETLRVQIDAYRRDVLLARGYEDIVKNVRDFGIKIDGGISNFAPVRGGGLMYLDTVDWPSGVVAFNKDRIQHQIDLIDDSEKKKRVQRYLSRLVELREELAVYNWDSRS